MPTAASPVQWLTGTMAPLPPMPAGLTVFAAHHGDSAEPFSEWVTDAAVAFWAGMREEQARAPGAELLRVVVLVIQDSGGDGRTRAAAAAGLAALRGMVLSLAVELGSVVRLNLVRCATESTDEIASTLAYLASGPGSYLTATTVLLEDPS